MLYCEKCKISIRTEHKWCPLCHGAVSGSAAEEEAVFPVIPVPKKKQISFFKMLTFCCVLALIFSYVINHIVISEHKWFFYVAGGTCFVWIVLVWGKSKSKNLLKNTIWQTIIIGVGIGICDVFIGWKGWSLEYALPILLTVSIVFNLIVTIVKKLPESDYMIYLLINCVFGVIPWFLIKFHAVNFVIPSIICSGLAMILLAGLVIFKWNHLVNELGKKFHF